MAVRRSNLVGRKSEALGRLLSRVEVLALFPLVALLAVWLGLGDVVTVTAFALPALLALRTLGGAFGGAQMATAPDSAADWWGTTRFWRCWTGWRRTRGRTAPAS